jgi:hypothetical protein
MPYLEMKVADDALVGSSRNEKTKCDTLFYVSFPNNNREVLGNTVLDYFSHKIIIHLWLISH